jgi:serine/threonine-protein kinase
MVSMQMDGSGRLTFFRALPVESLAGTPRYGSDWTVALGAAGLDLGSLRETTPQLFPPVFADSRMGWTGYYSNCPEARVRVEAAAQAGRLVYFRLIPAWEANAFEPAQLDVTFQVSARPYPPSYSGRVLDFLIALAAAIAWVAWRNVNCGRGDRRGALRVAGFAFALWLVYGVSVGFGELAGAPERSWFIAAHALFWAAGAWMLYMALEPLVRRRWPYSLVSWSRLLSGDIRDPLVGRDILIGILVMSWFFVGRTLLPITIGSAIPVHVGTLLGTAPVSLATTISGALCLAVVFTLALATLRRIWAAFLLSAALLFVLNFFLVVPGRDLLQASAVGVYSLITVSVLVRFGVLACYTAMATSYLLFALPIGLDFQAWYQDAGRASVLLLAVSALWAFRSSLAGRRVVHDRLIS